MFQNYIGELSAFAVAIFWTITALSFESASLKVGTLSVNIYKLFIGFIFLSIFTWIKRGLFIPTDASIENWYWLAASGLVGFFMGDTFLLKSFTMIGSRFAMLIMTIVPPITALFGWIFLNEKLTFFNYVGMTITLIGISLAIFNQNDNKTGIKLKLSPLGVLYAFVGALGQAGGLILSKRGMVGNYDPFAATQIRLIAGFVCFFVLVSYLKRWEQITKSLKNRKGMVQITIGSFFGPFLGVSFSLLSIKFVETGIASTIMSIIPILIIPPYIFLYKMKVTILEIIGAVVSLTGVALFFIK